MTIKTRLDERKRKLLVDIYKNLTLRGAINFSSSSLPQALAGGNMIATCVRTWIHRAPMCEFHFSLPHCG